nr:probable transposase - Mycoplasma pulmonis insertion sequence IS1138 [Mycoplasmopsis pulmonis]
MKQLKPEQWKKWFSLYEEFYDGKINIKKYIFLVNKNIGKEWKNTYVKSWFFKKYSAFQKDEQSLISQTGKSTANKKNNGRPPKRKEVNEYTREELEEIVKIYRIIFDDISEKEIRKKIKEHKDKEKILTKISWKEFLFSKSTYYSWKKPKLAEPKKDQEIEEIIRKSFHENKGIFGRKRLEIYIQNKYKRYINYRKIGRILLKLNLFCKIRRAKRKNEIKNLNTKYQNLIQRDYNGKFNNIVATDVTYIPSPKDAINNHVYLSIAIHHQSKKIINWNLSKRNDVKLVLDHISKIKFDKEWIIHSDHGSQYSSNQYSEIIKENNGIISMSRIANSLNNREAEYFFSNIKSECLNDLKISKLSFKELQEIIQNYIDWYNNERLQSILEWKTPQQSWDVLSVF